MSSGDSGKCLTEFRAYSDDAWYAVKLSPEAGGGVRLSYSDISDEWDNVFHAWNFKSLKELKEFKGRFRKCSPQLQDEECLSVVVGTNVCASTEFFNGDLRFYDACVKEVQRNQHIFVKGEEECKCTFLLLWLHGPNAGKLSTKTTIESICKIQPAWKLDPIIASFLKTARARIEVSPNSNLLSNGITGLEAVAHSGVGLNSGRIQGFDERLHKETRCARRSTDKVSQSPVVATGRLYKGNKDGRSEWKKGSDCILEENMSKIPAGFAGMGSKKRKAPSATGAGVLASASPNTPNRTPRVAKVSSATIPVPGADAIIPKIKMEDVDAEQLSSEIPLDPRPSHTEKGKGKTVEGEMVVGGGIPPVWPSELDLELLKSLFSEEDHRLFARLKEPNWKKNINTLVKPMLCATSFLLFLSDHAHELPNAIDDKVTEDRRVLEAQKKSLDDEVKKLNGQLVEITKAKEENESQLIEIIDELEAKLKDSEGVNEKLYRANIVVENEKKALQLSVEGWKAKALRHKKAAVEKHHLYQSSGVFTFINAIRQVKHLNPNTELRVVGAHPSYEVVDGRLIDRGEGDVEVDLADEDLMDPLTDLVVPADFIDECVVLADLD